MKKILFILCCGLMMIAGSVKAQETLILNDDFNYLTKGTSYSGTGAVAFRIDTMPGHSDWKSWKGYQCMGSIKLGTASEAGYVRTPALNLAMDGGNFIVRLDAMAWKGDNQSFKIVIMHGDMTCDTLTVSGLDNVTAQDTLSNFLPFEVYCSGGDTATKIQIMGYQDAKSRIFVDNLSISTFSGSVITFTPAELIFNNVLENETVTDNLEVKGYNTNENSYQVTLTGNNFSTTVTTISKADLLNGYTIPVTYAPTAIGSDTAILGVGSIYKARIIGSCVSVQEISTLAEFKDKISCDDINVELKGTEFFKYTGEALITSMGENKNGYKYLTIQDASAAILVFDQQGDFISLLNKGATITNLIGTITSYYGMLAFIPTKDIEVVDDYADESQVQALEITMAQLADADFMKEHQSELVYLKGTITSTGSFAAKEYYQVSDEVVTDSAIFTLYRDADYIGSAIPNFKTSINGFVYLTYGKYYIVPRNMNDITSIESVNEIKVNVYPNPVVNELHFDGINPTMVEVYDVLGNKVASYNNVKNTISTSNLTNGTYFVRFITNEGNAVTKIVK
ncbi:MAG: T9SS type A sorting domain-containing protein [Bacteroidales bacterium]|nr:T9SS type A sorting domain-containing protein [Bacteroidales bacterium]